MRRAGSDSSRTTLISAFQPEPASAPSSVRPTASSWP